MKSINDLNRLVELITRHRLPKEQILFMEVEAYNKTQRFLKNLGSSGVLSVKLPDSNPEIECDVLKFGKCTFYIVQY